MPVKAYKVVRLTFDTRRVSAHAFSPASLTTYTPGEWTEAPIPGSGLFVFDTFANARDYYELLKGFTYGTEVWECECEEPVALPSNTIVVGSEGIERYWQEGGLADKTLGVSVPKGALLFKRVRLTNKRM